MPNGVVFYAVGIGAGGPDDDATARVCVGTTILDTSTSSPVSRLRIVPAPATSAGVLDPGSMIGLDRGCFHSTPTCEPSKLQLFLDLDSRSTLDSTARSHARSRAVRHRMFHHI